MQGVVEFLQEPKYTGMDVTIQELNARHGVAVPYYTLRNRFLGKTVPIATNFRPAGHWQA